MTPAPLTASETVYFHAERFAREKKLLDTAPLLHTDKKYDVSELAEAAFEAAFVAAEEAGAVRLERAKASRLFGLRKVDALFVHATGADGRQPPGTLEARIAQAAAQRPKEVQQVVRDVLAEDHTWPALRVLGLVLDGLRDRGLLETREEKRRLGLVRAQAYVLPESTRALAAAAPGERVKAQLDAWRPDDRPLLLKGVRDGIASRKEASDGPD